MKIIENNWNQSKEVVYKGNILIVPIWADWVATDENGVIVSFENEPCTVYSCWWWEEGNCTGDMLLVGKAEFEENEDWKQSLEYVGE